MPFSAERPQTNEDFTPDELRGREKCLYWKDISIGISLVKKKIALARYQENAVQQEEVRFDSLVSQRRKQVWVNDDKLNVII